MKQPGNNISENLSRRVCQLLADQRRPTNDPRQRERNTLPPSFLCKKLRRCLPVLRGMTGDSSAGL